MNSIFISFSIANTSVSDYFIALANKLNNDFHVVIITDTSKEGSDEISPEIEIFKWPSKRPIKWIDFIFINSKLTRYRPIIMISNFGAVNLFLLSGFIFGVKHRIAWAHSISTAFPTKKLLQLRKKYIYKLATRLFANSKAMKLDLVENFGVPETKVEVVFNAVKDPVMKVEKVKSYKIVFVGRIHPSKGIETLIEALPLVKMEFPEIELSVVGGNLDGEEIKSHTRRAEELQILKNISFLGNQTKQNVLKEFSEAYLSVVPSLMEAFGFVVIESFSVKTPVIGSRTSGIAEIIRDGKDGFLFEPGNSRDLATKIIRLLKDRNLRKTFSENCYNRFLSEFEVEQSTDKLAGKITQLIKR